MGFSAFFFFFFKVIGNKVLRDNVPTDRHSVLKNVTSACLETDFFTACIRTKTTKVSPFVFIAVSLNKKCVCAYVHVCVRGGCEAKWKMFYSLD